MELGVPKGTLYGWFKKEETGDIDLGAGSRTPSNALSLAAEIKILREKTRNTKRKM